MNTEEALKKEKEEKLNLRNFFESEMETKGLLLKDKENLESQLSSEKEQNMKLKKMIEESSRATKSEMPFPNPEQYSSLMKNNEKFADNPMLIEDKECALINGHSKNTEDHTINQQSFGVRDESNCQSEQQATSEEEHSEYNGDKPHTKEQCVKPKSAEKSPQSAHYGTEDIDQILECNELPSPYNVGNALGRVVTPIGQGTATQHIVVLNKITNIYNNNIQESIAIEDNTWPEGFCRDFRKYLFPVCVAMDQNKPKLLELAKSICIANMNGFDAKQLLTAWYMQQIEHSENNNNKCQDMWFTLLTILKKCLCDFLEHLKYEEKIFVKLHSKGVINGDQYKRVRAGGSENIQYIIRDIILECNMEGFNHFKLALDETGNKLLLSCITLQKDKQASNGF